MTSEPPADVGRSPAADVPWDSAYQDDWAPWEIGRPQAAWVRLLDEGKVVSPVLDSGCGTGELSLLLAARGLDVVGVDVSPTAIKDAIAKAESRELNAEFLVCDVLALEQLGRQFATVMDSGVFHLFDDSERVLYVHSLATALQPDGVLYLLCFSEHTPGSEGRKRDKAEVKGKGRGKGRGRGKGKDRAKAKAAPRRVTQEELREAFSSGWRIEQIEAAQIEVRESYDIAPANAWLARIVHTP